VGKRGETPTSLCARVGGGGETKRFREREGRVYVEGFGALPLLFYISAVIRRSKAMGRGGGGEKRDVK